MLEIALVPVAAAACFGALAPRVAALLPPRHATWMLSAGGMILALSSLAVLAFLASTLVAQVPDVASVGHWSVATLRSRAPVDGAVAAAALLGACAALTAVMVVARRRGLALLAARRACKHMPSGAGDLVVITHGFAGAAAVPGRPGRIVVARSLLVALSARERRALLAHERAHLEHRHQWHLSAVLLAVAANPLLAPLRVAITHATERWADEHAAEEVGDRRAVAAALTAAALVTSRSRRAARAVMAAGACGVPVRVEALLRRPPRARPELVLLTVLLLLAGVVATVAAGKETEHLFEFAGRAYHAAHPT